jgi:hypothetical protein
MQDLFLGVTDFARRADILEHFLTTKELIPSLWTLISDIKYLKQLAKILNMLLLPKLKKEKKREIRN